MNEHTQPPAIDINKVKNKLIQQKNDIQRLEQEVDNLQKIVKEQEKESHKASTEAKLAVDDSELARSFNQKNYAPIIASLFEKPSKQLRNRAIIIILIATALSLAAGYFSAGYLTYTQNILLNEKIGAIQDQLTQFMQQQKIQQEITKKQIEVIALKRLENKNQSSEAPITPIVEKSSAASIEKENTIIRQAKNIVQYIREAESQPEFIKDYKKNKTQFAQLYLIVMQYASNENIFYDSYLKAIEILNIPNHIAPKNTDELLLMDLEFLRAAYSGFVITSEKNKNGWRYRESDRQFSSYYNSALEYDLGAWQIINEKNDYQSLPNVFALNIDRVVQQVLFNNASSRLMLPEQTYYHAYPESNKNQAVGKLLNQEKIEKNGNTLTIDASRFNIPISEQVKKSLENKLAKKGIDINSAGDNLTIAINRYRASQGWEENGIINLRLLHSLNIYPTYSDLKNR
ncbi:hypothetical protein ACVBE9_10280 [Eionea flava]